jgi:hypothetical protein
VLYLEPADIVRHLQDQSVDVRKRPLVAAYLEHNKGIMHRKLERNKPFGFSSTKSATRSVRLLPTRAQAISDRKKLQRKRFASSNVTVGGGGRKSPLRRSGSEELRRRARREAIGRVSAPLITIANALEGMDRASAARLAGMDRQTLRDWVHRYNAEGNAELCNRPARDAGRS